MIRKTEYRTNKSGVYQARNLCQHCGAVINPWHRCGQVPTLWLVESTRTCPKCGKPSGIKAYYGKGRLVPKKEA
jgi:hypothetical protein